MGKYIYFGQSIISLILLWLSVNMMIQVMKTLEWDFTDEEQYLSMLA